MVSLDKETPQTQKRIVLGVVIIALGVMALFVNVLSGMHLLHFWPVMFIAFGCIKISQAQDGQNSTFGAVLVVLGVFLILSNFGFFHMHDLWPLFLIGAGVLMLVKKPGDMWKQSSTDTQDAVNVFAILSGNESKVVSQSFKGGEVTSVLGGAVLDCRDASIEGRAVVQVFALLGGVELKVPADWSVVNNTTAIMGGVDDRTVAPVQKDKVLVIEGFVALGGIEIKN